MHECFCLRHSALASNYNKFFSDGHGFIECHYRQWQLVKPVILWLNWLNSLISKQHGFHCNIISANARNDYNWIDFSLQFKIIFQRKLLSAFKFDNSINIFWNNIYNINNGLVFDKNIQKRWFDILLLKFNRKRQLDLSNDTFWFGNSWLIFSNCGITWNFKISNYWQLEWAFTKWAHLAWWDSIC